MKNLIKIIAIVLLLASCSKHEIVNLTKLNYELNTDQEYVIDIDIVVLEGAELYLEDMIAEVNADYYNRYGIAVNVLSIKEDTLEDVYKYKNRVFLPQDFSDERQRKITVYIIPEDYIYLPAAAYGVLQSNSIILGESSQKNRTLAHEIAHQFHLDHLDLKNNVMRIGYIASQYDTPNDFTEGQIEQIKEKLTAKIY